MKYIWDMVKKNKLLIIAAIVIAILAYNSVVG